MSKVDVPEPRPAPRRAPVPTDASGPDVLRRPRKLCQSRHSFGLGRVAGPHSPGRCVRKPDLAEAADPTIWTDRAPDCFGTRPENRTDSEDQRMPERRQFVGLSRFAAAGDAEVLRLAELQHGHVHLHATPRRRDRPERLRTSPSVPAGCTPPSPRIYLVGRPTRIAAGRMMAAALYFPGDALVTDLDAASSSGVCSTVRNRSNASDPIDGPARGPRAPIARPASRSIVTKALAPPGHPLAQRHPGHLPGSHDPAPGWPDG